MNAPLTTLISQGLVDLVCAGPPCPPWAGQGCKKGMKDKRAQVFFRIIIWAIVLIRCRGLVALVLENVYGILTQHKGRDCAMNHFLDILKHFCPEFVFRVDTLKLITLDTDFN